MNIFTSYYLRIGFIVLLAIASTEGLQAQVIDVRKSVLSQPVRSVRLEDTLKIKIFGDMMMHSDQISEAKTPEGGYKFDGYFSHIQKFLDDSDLNICNMEFTLAGKPYTGYPAFSAPDEFAEHIADCGFNVFLTANNHICDKQSEGMERTLQRYRELIDTKGIAFTGTASDPEEYDKTSPLFIDIKGMRIGIINATYGTNSLGGKDWPRTNYLGSKGTLKEALTKAEKEADIVMVFPHWGSEYILKHNQTQENQATWLAENGADIIIGSHPHVVQDYSEIKVRTDECVKDVKLVPVAYSLGNTVSNMSAINTQLGLMAEVTIIRKLNGRISVLPVEFTYLWCSRPGEYSSSYTVLPVHLMKACKEDWIDRNSYDKMISTYQRVSETTGIKDNIE